MPKIIYSYQKIKLLFLLLRQLLLHLQTPLSENEALIMSDASTRSIYQKEYERRASLYYQGQPPFDFVLGVIQQNLPRL